MKQQSSGASGKQSNTWPYECHLTLQEVTTNVIQSRALKNIVLSNTHMHAWSQRAQRADMRTACHMQPSARLGVHSVSTKPKARQAAQAYVI